VIAEARNQATDAATPEATGIRKNWGWFFTLGFVQILIGMIAVGFSIANLASSSTLGVLLLIAGTAQLVAALLARHWDAFYLFLLLALLYGVAGFLMLENALIARDGMTLMLAALFLLVGLFRIVVSLVDNLPFWRWVLFNGVVAALVGLAMWRHWPASGYWVVNILVGIELVANGVTWSALAVGLRCSLFGRR
jgi:uncharacterized membrane protein HdeD (DUF308 family)